MNTALEKKVILIVLFCFSSGACKSIYLKNRFRDAADIITLEAETRAYGATVRLGPVKAGIYYKDPNGSAIGLRGGTFGRKHTTEFTALFIGADYLSATPLEKLINRENTTDNAGSEKNEDFEDSLLKLRRKEFHAFSPFGTRLTLASYRSLFKEKNVFVSGYYFTQIEISVALFFGLKIGLNLGELLDFLLGFFKIDIFGDDAPYPDPLLEDLRRTPYWQQLDKKSRRKIIEELR